MATNAQGMTAQEMGAYTERLMKDRVNLASQQNPGVLQVGAQTGQVGTGTGVTPVTYQAMTYNTPQQPVVQTTPGVPNGTNAAPTAPTAPTEPTAGQIYSSAGVDPELQAAYDAQKKSLQETQGPIDEATIRANTLQKFQAEIDALDRFYAEKKRQQQNAEFVVGEARLGTGAAIQARRGMLGSDFGAAQTDKTTSYNNSIQQSIADQVDSERRAEVATILSGARVEADKEIADKKAAKVKGAQDYIDFLKGAADRKAARVTEALTQLAQTNANPDDKTLEELAASLGVDKATLKSKLATVAAGTSEKPVEVGGVLYQKQADGTYKSVTPTPEDKPLIVGGQAYQKQADGTYKSITPAEAAKPITKTIGKVIYNSTDGGLTWQRANMNGGAPAPKGAPRGNTPTTNVTEKNALATIQQGIANNNLSGPDGFIAPETYQALRDAWVKDKLNPTAFDTKMKGYKNPNNPNYVN